MKRLSFFIATLCLVAIFAPAVHAQDMDKVKENLVAAQKAFDSGDYRTTLSRVQVIETETRGVIFPATSYLKIMSYYRLGQYQNCLDAANAYLSSNRVLRDETLTQINAAVSDSRSKLAAAEAAERAAAERAAAERAAAERAAEAKRKLDADAASEWARISTSTDLTVLSTFLGKYKGTPSERPAQDRYNDERAWQNATREHTLTGYENYLNGSTIKNYRQNARDILERDYPVHCKEHAGKGNIKNMEDMYNRYVRMFPNGREKQNMQDAMCAAYEKQGYSLSSTRKNVNSLYQANELFEKRQKLCNTSNSVARAINSNQRKIKDLKRPSGHFFIGYSATGKEMLGGSLGWLSQHSLGFFVTFRMNTVAFKEGKTFDALPEDFFDSKKPWSKITTRTEKLPDAPPIYPGTPSRAAFNDIRITQTPLREFEYGEFSALFGLNKRIFYPVWLYAGGGVNRVSKFYSISTETYTAYRILSNVEKTTTDIVVDRFYSAEKPKWFPQIEAGLQLRLKPVYLSVGYRSNFQDNGACVTFGGGFAF